MLSTHEAAPERGRAPAYTCSHSRGRAIPQCLLSTCWGCGQAPFMPRRCRSPVIPTDLQCLVLSQNPGAVKTSTMLWICFSDWTGLIKIIKGGLLSGLLTWLDLLSRMKRGFHSPLGSSSSKSSYLGWRAKHKLLCPGATHTAKCSTFIFSTSETSFFCT